MGLLPTVSTPGMGYQEALYRGFALAQLSILRQQMKLGGLKTGNRVLRLDGGVEIKCSICFNQETVNIYVPPVDDNSPVSSSIECTIYKNIKLNIKLPHATGDVYGFLPGITINTINLEKLPGTIFNILTNTGGYYYSNKHERLSNYFIDNEENRSLFGLNDYYFGGFEECNVPEARPAVVVWFINGELHPTDRLAVKLYFFIQKADGTVCPYHADAERIAEVQEYHPERIPPDYYPVYLPQKPPDTSSGVAPTLLETESYERLLDVVCNMHWVETASQFIARRGQVAYNDVKRFGVLNDSYYLRNGSVETFAYRVHYGLRNRTLMPPPPPIAYFEVHGAFIPASDNVSQIIEAYASRTHFVVQHVFYYKWHSVSSPVQGGQSYYWYKPSIPGQPPTYSDDFMVSRPALGEAMPEICTKAWDPYQQHPDACAREHGFDPWWYVRVQTTKEHWQIFYEEGVNDEGIAYGILAYAPYRYQINPGTTAAWIHGPDEYIEVDPPVPPSDDDDTGIEYLYWS